MGCKNRQQFQEKQEQDKRSSSSKHVNDALLLTTMCLIGLSVDVHIKDGSVYSGIFHTASVDDHYAIVLKSAKMIKKGTCKSNVASEDVIETLVIHSKDLVQVVPKKVLLPANGSAGHETGDNTVAVACTPPSNGTPLAEGNKISNKPNVGQAHANQTRCSSGTENGFANGLRPEISHPTNAHQVQAKTSIVSAPSTVSSEPLVSSSAPSETVTSKISNRASKEFKLNPQAKIFSPSFPNKRSTTPPAIANNTNLAYIHDSYQAVPVATQQPEVEISPYAPRSLPLKFLPYGGNDVQHPQPVIGYMHRAQPVRNGGQYHQVQTAPTYVQPSPQNVMVGRLGPVVYVHPVSQDIVPSTTGFPQMSTCSILTPHQIHVPKHQVNAAGQALQLCATPPFIAAGGGQAPFVLPSHIPISQPPYPMIRPMSVPGSNGYFVSKFS
uniref:polyadenylate-binding protein-interacting protein 4 isoform X2 n=1 Tax=Erigeron canadensis TaxID=72917 RepID=UPI001CB8FA4A|nr:polyadenylate-binding protein-interacting protein 4 isoform X2 [Erigeron canadensis]